MECCRDILKLHKDLNKQILTCAAMSTAGNYLYAHSANTAIIAMCMANHMEMDDNSQIFAGYCGLLHDIGMPAVMHIAKREKKLSAEESDKLARFIRIRSFAVEVLESEEEADAWLREKNIMLHNERPLDFLDTDSGSQLVEDLLGRIAHGIPS